MTAPGLPPGQPPQPPSWRLHPMAELHWRDVDGEWLVYEALSGQTACLNPFAAAVLMCFEDRQPHNLQQVREKLAGEFNLEAGAADGVADIVEQCRLLDFLVPLPPDAAFRAAAP